VERVEIAASLQHFVENWQIELADPNPLFDVRYYLGMNPDVSNAGAHPLMHFVVAGAAEMRDPSREFSMRGYYSLHADVEKSKTNALGHYLRFGIEEGRSACSVSSFKEKSDHRVFTIPSNLPRLVALEPSFDDFITLADRSHDEANTRGVRTDVIIPVYKGKAETLRCIYSVLKAKCETEFRLVVINDQSPDAELSESLRSLAKHNKFVLLENEQNVGFVASVNRGMNYSNNDILLLNSDTEVFPGWLDRIQAAAYSKESIGTVTPLSNSATICSYPNWCQDNSQVLELPPAGIDEICRTVNSSQYHEIPTAVGFCMYIKRECYRNVGEFDALKFGKGYCEENDFCLRASDKGWSHILTTDTYVLHYGGTSFGAEKNDRITKSLEIIRREYPYYESEVTRHIRVDPSLAARIQIDLERLDRVLLPRRFLFVSHTRGGGTTKHMTDMEQLLKKEGVSILYMESSDSGKIFIRTNSLASENIPNVCAVYLNSEPRLLADLILGLNIEHAHVHSLIDFEQAASGALRKSFEMADIKYDFTLHDYAPICPRVNLIDDSHKFCGGVAPKKCQQCVDRNNSSFGFVNVENWTASNKEFLRGARCVFGPSVDVIERTREQCPEANYVLRRHPEELPPLKTVRSQVSLVQKSSMRCIGIIGAVGIHKGSEILLACAKDAQARSLPLSFKIIGYSENQTSLAALPNVHWTGPYEEQDVFKLIRDEGLDIAWFPAVWPETFSYTLSVALLSGIVPVAFDLGAVAERLRLANTGALMPLSMMSDPSAINDYLCELELTPPLDEAVLKEQFLIYESCLKDYYNIFAQS
jgi:GT2 family glycosyltransferase